MKNVRNVQITKITGKNLERLPSREKFDSTVDERERNYQSSPPNRFSEYR